FIHTIVCIGFKRLSFMFLIFIFSVFYIKSSAVFLGLAVNFMGGKYFFCAFFIFSTVAESSDNIDVCQ
ncbi:MAG TPA: hypothetical protein VJY83_07855, partial [Thiopseudomonas sp.]|nr:hypothetical protein [Thiopseudomonas sp.]